MKVIENWRRTINTDDVSGGLRDESRPAAGEHAHATARNLGEAPEEDSHDDIKDTREGQSYGTGGGGGGRGGGGEGGGGDGDSDSSEWSDSEEDSDLNANLDSRATSEGGCVRTNLCTILKKAVLPMASGRFAQIVASPTLEDLHDDAGLLLTPLEFDDEKVGAREIGVHPALQTGNPGSDDRDFWFKFSRTDQTANKPVDRVSSDFPNWFLTSPGDDGLKMPRPANQDEPEPDRVKEYRKELLRHRRNMRLKLILNKMHDISQGKSGMVLTCGIGVIRKRLDKGKYMNCALLEIDLCCSTDKQPFEFSPGYDSDCHDDVTCNTKIRLCS
jgi:hypothetical protein